MVKRLACLAALMVACTGLGFADGGKINWTTCKNEKDFERLQGECKQFGQPMFIFFTGSSCHYCQEMDKGSLQDSNVIKTADRFVKIMNNDNRLASLGKKFNITGIPAGVFLDPEGKEVARMSDRTADGLVKQFNDIADKHTRAPKWTDSEKGLEAAKTGGQPVAMFLCDDSPRTAAVEKAFSELALASFLEKLTWVKKTMDWKSDEAKKLGITAPTLYIVDPKADDMMTKPLKKITLPKAAAGLKADFEAVLKSYKGEPTSKDEKKEGSEGTDK